MLVVGNDLGKLITDVVRVDRLATNFRQSRGGILDAALLDIVTGGLGCFVGAESKSVLMSSKLLHPVGKTYGGRKAQGPG